MFRDAKSFSSFSVDDVAKAKAFYQKSAVKPLTSGMGI